MSFIEDFGNLLFFLVGCLGDLIIFLIALGQFIIEVILDLLSGLIKFLITIFDIVDDLFPSLSGFLPSLGAIIIGLGVLIMANAVLGLLRGGTDKGAKSFLNVYDKAKKKIIWSAIGSSFLIVGFIFLLGSIIITQDLSLNFEAFVFFSVLIIGIGSLIFYFSVIGNGKK